MILPIVAYGDKVLRTSCDDIEMNHNGLKELIDNMWDTMYNANGVGLAAPQIGEHIRLFIVDSKAMYDEGEEHKGIKKVFINATMLDEYDKEWTFEEGCLSIPNVREDVVRHSKIRIEYYDEKFKRHEEEFDSYNARVIQHEYDHIEGILFTDHIKPLKKKMLHKVLQDISKGFTKVKYKMRFPFKK